MSLEAKIVMLIETEAQWRRYMEDKLEHLDECVDHARMTVEDLKKQIYKGIGILIAFVFLVSTYLTLMSLGIRVLK